MTTRMITLIHPSLKGPPPKENFINEMERTEILAYSSQDNEHRVKNDFS